MSTASRPGWVVTLIATAGGAGLLRGAPGTYGTIVAMPLCYALGRLGPAVYLGATLFVIGLGSWAAGRYCAATGKHDNQQIVIDEVAGYLVTMALGPFSPFGLLVGLGLFRLFDIWKPGPVRLIDRRVKGGFGVMADDLAAGVLGAAAMRLLLLVPWPTR